MNNFNNVTSSGQVPQHLPRPLPNQAPSGIQSTGPQPQPPPPNFNQPLPSNLSASIPPPKPGTAGMNHPINQIQQPQQQFKANLHSNRYPQAPPPPTLQQQQNTYYQQPQQQTNIYSQQQQSNFYQQPQNNVTNSGFNKLWGQDQFDLLQTPNILPPEKTDST